MSHIYHLMKLAMFGYEDSTLAWVQASYSEFWEVIKGVQQGGPSAPGFFGDYTVDMPMLTFRCAEWEQGEKEDTSRLRHARDQL